MIITKEYKSSSSSAVYKTSLDTDTCQSSCSCKGWTFQRGNKPRSCRHTKDLEEANNINSININSLGINNTVLGTLLDSAIKNAKNSDTTVAASTIPSPMLASAQVSSATLDEKIKPFLTNNFVMEEKLDGHRLLVEVKKGSVTATARPRANKEANKRTLPRHLVEAFKVFPDGLYDGELYVPEGTSTDVVDLERQDELEFGIFDIIESTGNLVINRKYTERRDLLEEIFFISNINEDKGVNLLPNMPISVEAIQGIWKRGGEGVIIKDINSTYKFGARSPQWIKIKRNDSAILTITGFEEGLNGPHSIACLKDGTDLTTTVKVLNNEILAEVEKDPASFIGKKLVISHMGKTNNGIWKHAVWDHIL